MAGAVEFEQLLRRVHGGTAIGAEAVMAAVVQNDIRGVTALLILLNLSDQIRRDSIGGRFFPIVGHRVPGHGLHAEFSGDAQCDGAARAVRRAKEMYGFADELFQRVARAREFFANASRGDLREIRMTPGVIADEMSCVCDATDQGGFGLREFADQEEGRVRIVRGENIEQLRRPGGVGAVVEGER